MKPRKRQPALADIGASIAILEQDIAKRQRQRADAVEALSATREALAAAQAARDERRLPALADGDETARAAYSQASVDARHAADMAAEHEALIQQLDADLVRLERDRQAAIRAEALASRAQAEQRNAERRVQLRQFIADQVAPLLTEMLDEIAAMGQRLEAAGFSSEVVNQSVREQTNLGVEVRELLYQATVGHKFFARALVRPSREDRSRIPDMPPPATDLDAAIDEALAAAEAEHTTH